MGQLRDRMEQDLKLKGVSPATIRNYRLYARKFAGFFMRSPAELGAAEVQGRSSVPRENLFFHGPYHFSAPAGKRGFAG